MVRSGPSRTTGSRPATSRPRSRPPAGRFLRRDRPSGSARRPSRPPPPLPDRAPGGTLADPLAPQTQTRHAEDPVTDNHSTSDFPRPAPGTAPGPLDDRFYDLVESRFRELVRENPVFATGLGLHADDDLLGDGSREAVLARLDADRAHLSEIDRLDPRGLSPEAAFERDIERHNVRRAIFDADRLRIWERRSTALDVVGDGLFLLFARDHAPLTERLDAIAGRLEAAATYLEEAKTRATVPQVRPWQRIEIETAGELPVFFDELVAAGNDSLGRAEQRRLERASESAKIAVELYASWLDGTLPNGTDEWAIGRELHEEMVGLRAFDG